MKIRLGRNSAPTKHLGRELPIQWEEGPFILGGVFGVLFGGMFAAFPLFALYLLLTGGEVSGSRVALWVMIPLFLVVGLGILAAGINAFFSSTSIWIDATSVRLRRGGLLWGRANWTEPLSGFQGVLAEETYHSGGKNRSSYTTYEIHLKHRADDDRDIELYNSRDGTNHRKETEEFSRLLGVSVLSAVPDGSFLERNPEDVDKSLRELAREGKVNESFDPAELPTNARVQVERSGAGYLFKAGMKRSLPLSLLFAAAGVGLLYWYFGPGVGDAEGSPWVMPVVGGVFALIGGLTGLQSAFGTELLAVTADEVEAGVRLFGRMTTQRRLDAAEIEEVGLRKDKHGRFALTIAGDRKKLTYGSCLTNEDREFVRRGIVATLARGARWSG